MASPDGDGRRADDVAVAGREAPTAALPRTPASRTAWLSWLKVLSIAAVVTIHTVGATAVAGDARATWHGRAAIVLDIASIFAVPVFVMVSGALTLSPTAYRGAADFLRRRAGRIVPALVFWHLWYVGVLVFVLHRTSITPRYVVVHTLDGTLYTALYFFWIVLGLSLVAPVLIPFVAATGRRGALVAGTAGALVPVVMSATTGLRGVDDVFVETAWTWWFPYVGLFLLGAGLRTVVLRGPALAACVAGTVAVAGLLSWQWRNPEAPALLQTLSPVSYYGAGVVLLACGVYLSVQGLVQPSGLLGALTSPAATRWGRTLGDATLGVFGLHLTVLLAVRELPRVGGDPAAESIQQLVARVLLVLVATYAIVLPLRRVPGVRAVL